MKFCGYRWLHNPREIVFETDKRLRESLAHDGGSVLQQTGRRAMVITGEGELFGEDCIAQFQRLLKLFRRGGCGVLAIEGIKPVYAVFESLRLVGTPRRDVLTYRFVFREVTARSGGRPTELTVGQGDTLWDISYRFGIDIDTLVRLNPQVMRPDVLREGEVVRLC